MRARLRVPFQLNPAAPSPCALCPGTGYQVKAPSVGASLNPESD